MKGWTPDDNEVMHLKQTLDIFNFCPDDSDMAATRRTVMRTEKITSSSSSQHSIQFAAAVSASGGSSAIPGIAFSAAMQQSAGTRRSRTFETWRHEEHSNSRVFDVHLNLADAQLLQKLVPQARDDFLQRGPAYIYSNYGPFRASQMDLGGSVVTTMMRERRETESEINVDTELSSQVQTLTVELSASASTSFTTEESRSAGTTTVNVEAIGGDPHHWMSGNAATAEMQSEWSASFTDSNLAIIHLELKPLWDLIAMLDADKGRAFEDYCQTKWSDEAQSTQDDEAGRVFPTAPPSDRLVPGQSLLAGQVLTSGNGHVTLNLQGDGNLVIREGNSAKWSSDTHASGNRDLVFFFQEDGNAVLSANGRAIWSTGREQGDRLELVMQSDCNLVMYNSGRAVWSSGSRCSD